MESKYVVYSMPNCPDCMNAKNLLKREGKEFIEKLAGQDFGRDELLDLLGPVRTLPQITVETQDGLFHVGGYRDLVKLLAGSGASVRKVGQ